MWLHADININENQSKGYIQDQDLFLLLPRYYMREVSLMFMFGWLLENPGELEVVAKIIRERW